MKDYFTTAVLHGKIYGILQERIAKGGSHQRGRIVRNRAIVRRSHKHDRKKFVRYSKRCKSLKCLINDIYCAV